jgi:methenyltetrahydromethanopterin cyclohydrolase
MNRSSRLPLALGVLLICAYLLVTSLQNRVTVINETGTTIESATLRVSDTILDFSDLKAGEAVRATYRIRGDSAFHVSGRTQDGIKFDGMVGYVTNGFFGRRDVIRIKKKGVVTLDQQR